MGIQVEEEQLSHFREMDEDWEDVASLTNRDLSASRNRVRFECWFLALMQAQRRPDQTQHEPPVKPHPCFFNRCRSKGGKDSGTNPRRLARRSWPRTMPNADRFAMRLWAKTQEPEQRLHTTTQKPSIRLCATCWLH